MLYYNALIFYYFHNFLYYFTGSYPLPPQGWQRLILLIPSQVPLKTPYLFTASIAYCEHVGWYLHAPGSSGDMANL